MHRQDYLQTVGLVERHGVAIQGIKSPVTNVSAFLLANRLRVATLTALVILVPVLPHVRKMGHAMEILVKIPADQKLSMSVDILEKTAPMSEVITAVKEGR